MDQPRAAFVISMDWQRIPFSKQINSALADLQGRTMGGGRHMQCRSARAKPSPIGETSPPKPR